MSQITVTEETLAPNASVELIVDQQRKYVAVNGNTATVSELLNAIFEKTGQDDRVVRANSDGTITLDRQVYIVREGSALSKTTNGHVEVHPGDTVVEDRPHHNG